YWMQLAEVKNAYSRLIAEHPGGLGKYQTKEELMDFIVSKYAPGPYSINPETVEQGTKPTDEDPFKPSVLDSK
ncbi:MAG: hypothetical protein J6328_07370, partial [Bacilli bacterium]|nr:hypothetical protein [Bacilli bacterium]